MGTARVLHPHRLRRLPAQHAASQHILDNRARPLTTRHCLRKWPSATLDIEPPEALWPETKGQAASLARVRGHPLHGAGGHGANSRSSGQRRRVRPWTTGKKRRSRPGGAYAPIPETTSTRARATWRTVSTRGLAAPDPLSMGSPPLVFYRPAACAAHGRIFPDPGPVYDPSGSSHGGKPGSRPVPAVSAEAAGSVMAAPMRCVKVRMVARATRRMTTRSRPAPRPPGGGR